jgi:tetratricopeptide (TPR) repeat protein
MRQVLIGVVAALVLAAGAQAFAAGGMPPSQGIRDVGSGPSQNFQSSLPSGNINRTLGSTGFTGASQFTGGPSGYSGGYGPGGAMQISLEHAYEPVTLRTASSGPGFEPLVNLKVRTIDSLNFDKRARFVKLRETSMALVERIHQTEKGAPEQLSLGFRQFMFPFPLQDSKDLGYGFFSRMDLVGGGTVPSEAFLASFTGEVQQSLGEKSFLDITQAMLLGRALPEGASLDRLYDTQLAALANYLLNNNRYASAASVWAVRVERDESSSVAHRGLALCLLATGQAKKAAVEARRSLTTAPGWPDKLKITGSNWQDVFPSLRDLAEAQAELDAQLKTLPDDPDLKFMAGFVDLFMGNWKSAEDRLTALGAKDEAAVALLKALKGKAVAATIEQATNPAVRKAIQDRTGLEEPVMSLEVRRELAQALRSGPDSYEDRMRIGDFRFYMGDFTLAGESYRAAHKLRPEDPFALFMLAHASYANSEYQLAVRYLKGALALEPNWGLYEFRLQEFYGDESEYQKHLRNLERQVEMRPNGGDMKFLLAYIYYFSGRFTDAANLLADIMRKEPDFAQAGYFLRLARLQG